MSNETTLLPCPFCGGEAEKLMSSDGFTSIGCLRCSPIFGVMIQRGSEAEAIAAWNTRAELGSGTLTAEQVRECVQHVYHEGYSDGSVRRGAHIDETDWQAIADELNAHVGRTCEACAFSKPTDLTDGCAALERIAELEEECDQLREAVAYWQRMYEEQIGVRR